MAGALLKADIIIRDANIITVAHGQPKAEAVAIRDGKFIYVGENQGAKALAGRGTRMLDMAGKTVLPGFIDAHIHVLYSGIRHVMATDCDQPGVLSIQKALRERCKATPTGQWVQGFKFDDTKTKEKRFLTRQDLDAVSKRHPIMVTHRAGHVYYLNSLALEMAGFHSETPDPLGGRFGRNSDSGELDGVVYERAIEHVRQNLLPPVTQEVRRKGLKRICQMLHMAGITSAHDAKASDEDLVTYQQGKDAGELTLRLYVLMHVEHLKSLKEAGVRTGFGDARLRLGGIKLQADGAIAARTAYLSEPYVGSDDHGILTTPPEEMDSLVMEAHRAGFQVCVHANGDSAIDMVLTAYEKAQKAYPRKDARHRIEHCTLVNPDLLRRMKTLGCVATPFCTYVYYHGEKMHFFGEERLQWMFAQRSFIDHGIVSTGASDYPPGPFEPLMGIQSCVTRTDSDGRVWGPSQKITVEEALRVYTINGAYASFEENIKGSIEVGKLADLVILGADPTKTDPYAIQDIPVEMTMVGGEAVSEK